MFLKDSKPEPEAPVVAAPKFSWANISSSSTSSVMSSQTSTGTSQSDESSATQPSNNHTIGDHPSDKDTANATKTDKSNLNDEKVNLNDEKEPTNDQVNIPTDNVMQNTSDAIVDTKVEDVTHDVSDNVDTKPVIADEASESAVKPDSNGNFATDDNENLPNKKCFAHNETHDDKTKETIDETKLNDGKPKDQDENTNENAEKVKETDDKTPLTNGDIASEEGDAKEEVAANGEGNEDKAGLTYKDDQWSPLNIEGKKQYDRDFLMSLQTNPLSLQKPDLPNNMDVILDAPNLRNVTSAPNLKNFDHPPIRSSASYQRTPK